MEKKRLSDEDVERILREYRESKKQIPIEHNVLEKDSKNVKICKMILSKAEDFLDSFFEYIYSKVARSVQAKRLNPYNVEFLMGYGRCVTILFFILPLVLIIGIPAKQLLVSLIMWLFGFIFAFAIHTLTAPLINRTLLGILLDKVTGKKENQQKICIENFTPKITSWMFGWGDSIIDVFYPDEYQAIAANMHCRILSNNVCPKSSSPKDSFKLYKDTEGDSGIAISGCKKYNLIMTRQKSDLFDRLIELEPTAEFEITYLKYSRQFQKIQPIPGWEYADGVQELCDEISNMYP